MQESTSARERIVFVLGSLKVGGAERNLSKTASYLAKTHEVHIILFENIIQFSIDPSIQVHVVGLSQYKSKLTKLVRLYSFVTATVWRLRPRYAVAFARVSSQLLTLSFFPRVIARFDSYPFDI